MAVRTFSVPLSERPCLYSLGMDHRNPVHAFIICSPVLSDPAALNRIRRIQKDITFSHSFDPPSSLQTFGRMMMKRMVKTDICSCSHFLKQEQKNAMADRFKPDSSEHPFLLLSVIYSSASSLLPHGQSFIQSWKSGFKKEWLHPG